MYRIKPRTSLLSSNASCFERTSVERFTVHNPAITATDIVQCESVLDVRVDGHPFCTLTCSPEHLKELALGHLRTEGIINSCEEIEKISVDSSASVVNVRLASANRVLSSLEGTPDFSNSTSNSCRLPAQTDPIEPFESVFWTEPWIYYVAREFAKDKTSHARTRGCHSAYLANRESILCMREDIGRHNAFDKVVGWALLNGIDLGTCLLYTSGRVPTDMVLKAIRARIPILVSKSVTTDRSIGFARAAGLVLLCEAMPESFELLSGNPPSPAETFAKAI